MTSQLDEAGQQIALPAYEFCESIVPESRENYLLPLRLNKR